MFGANFVHVFLIVAMDDEGKVALVVQIVQRTLESRDDVADVRCDIFKVCPSVCHQYI